MLEKLVSKITEHVIEKFAIELLKKQGFLYASESALDSDTLLPKLMSGELQVAI